MISDTINELKIIKSGNARFKVTSVKNATKQVAHIVNQFQGYISDQRLQTTNYNVENRFTIKVPQRNFENVMDSLEKVAEFVDYQNITSNDVTEQYVDLESRLKTKLEVKKRYETVLIKRANTVKDILAAEEKLVKSKRILSLLKDD